MPIDEFVSVRLIASELARAVIQPDTDLMAQQVRGNDEVQVMVPIDVDDLDIDTCRFIRVDVE